MKATLLLVPTKKTEDCNWTKALNNYLLSIHGSLTEFEQDVKQFHKLRQDIRGANADQTGLQLYLLYFSQLELLDLRIPFSSMNRHKYVSFVWHDAFLPASEHKQYALPFEKASVLFNVGSLMTKAALMRYAESQKSSATDDTSFKEAVQLLQQAAGVFTFLSANFLHAPSNDLNPATVKFLINLCLAQSQEIFNLKVIDGDLEQKKNSLISKLCKSTSKHYQDCFDSCSHLLTPEGSSAVSDHSTFAVLDTLDDSADDFDLTEGDNEYDPDKLGIPDDKVTARLDPFWISVIQFKAIYYNSLAYYFHALQLEATNKFGEAIAYLTKSTELINEISGASLKVISKAGAENAYELLDNYKYQKDALAIKLKDITKDNDLIYHDIVPSVVTIAEPKPMDSAKVIPMSKIELFNKVNEYNYNNFLPNVVPISIHELMSYYSEEKSQFLRNELDEVDVSNEEMSSVLEYLKFPKALVNIKEMVNEKKSLSSKGDLNLLLDPEVIGKVQEIASKYSLDQENRRFIDESKSLIYKHIGDSESLLAGNQYTPSYGQFRDDLIKLKKTLYDASNSDSRLFALVDSENSALYQTLGKGANSTEFKSMFKTPSPGETKKSIEEEISLLDIDDSKVSKKNDSIDETISRLEDIMHELNVLKTNKTKLVDNLKVEIHNDDIAPILMLNSKIKSTNEIKSVIFPEELKKFDYFLKELDGLITKQRELIAEMRNNWDTLNSNPKVREIQTSSTFQKDLVTDQTRRISDFYENSWKRYTLGLTKGAEYYRGLARFAENLKRAIEGETRSGSLSQSMTGSSLHSDHTGSRSGSQTYQNPGLFFAPSRPDVQQRQQSYGSDLANYSRAPQQLPTQYSGQNPSFYGQAYTAPGPAQPAQTPQHSGFGAAYSQAPALPPKRPLQLQSYTQPQSYDPRSQSSGIEQSAPKSLGSGLIYDQPSAYQPNMYDFFLKKS